MTIGGSKVYTEIDKPTPSEIGAAAASHTHSYLPLSGGTMTGNAILNNNVNIVGKTGADIADSAGATVAAGATGTLIAYNTSHNFHLGAIMTDKKLTVGNTYLNAANNMYLRNVTSDGGIYLQVGGATRLSVNSTATTVSKLVTNQGITTGGSIVSNTALTDNLGSSSLPFNSGYAKQLNLVGEASKGYGYLSAYTVGTTSTNGEARLVLGNSTATGTASNASGSVFLYGTNTGYTRLVPSNNSTSNVTVNFPSGNGSIPLMNKGDTSYWGIVTPDGNASSWIRTTSAGLIPNNQDKEASIGTSSWQFKAMYATDFYGNLQGNAKTATTLAAARTINGTSFNGSANITTSNWGTARNITIGNATKSVNGSGNVSWSLQEIMKGQGLNAATACGTLYFNNNGVNRACRVSCYASSDNTNYSQIAMYDSANSSNLNYLNIYDTYMTTPKEFRCSENIRVNGKRLSITSSAPSSPSTGDIWIDI